MEDGMKGRRNLHTNK